MPGRGGCRAAIDSESCDPRNWSSAKLVKVLADNEIIIPILLKHGQLVNMVTWNVLRKTANICTPRSTLQQAQMAMSVITTNNQ
jgi:hypothetical protein